MVKNTDTGETYDIRNAQEEVMPDYSAFPGAAPILPPAVRLLLRILL